MDDLRLPDTSDTELFVSYAYTADDGTRQREELNLKGEDAEYHPYILRQMKAFLDKIGERLAIEPPVTVDKVMKAAAILLLASSMNFVQAYGNLHVHRRKLAVVSDIPMPTAYA